MDIKSDWKMTDGNSIVKDISNAVASISQMKSAKKARLLTKSECELARKMGLVEGKDFIELKNYREG